MQLLQPLLSPSWKGCHHLRSSRRRARVPASPEPRQPRGGRHAVGPGGEKRNVTGFMTGLTLFIR